MIKTEEKIVTKEVKEVVSERFFCDMCGKEINYEYGFGIESYKYKIKKGNSYPEGTDYVEKSAYFCRECNKKVTDFLNKNNVNFGELKISY